MAIERTTFNGIVVGPYTYPAVRKPDGLYVRTMSRKAVPALEFMVDALSNDVDVLFDGERIPIKRHGEAVLRDPWKIVVGTLASDHDRRLLSLFGINPLFHNDE